MAGGTPALAQPLPAHPSPALLLIDASVAGRLPKLGGCDREMVSLRDRLDRMGASNQLLVDPSANELRRELLQLTDPHARPARVFVVCGYAAVSGSHLFLLPSDATPGDPGRDAISVMAFSRLLRGEASTIALDLHPTAADQQVASAVAAWVGGAVTAERRLASVDDDPNQAALIQRLTRPDTPMDDLLPMPAVPPSAVAAKPASVTPPMAVVSPAPPSPAPEPHQPAAPPQPLTLRPPPVAPPLPGPVRAAARHTATARRRPSHAAHKVDAPHRQFDDVTRQVQVSLLARGLFMGRVSGTDGPSTHASIRHFQLLLGQPPTGHLSADEFKQLTGG